MTSGIDWPLFLALFGSAAVLIALAVAAMAVGVLCRRPCLRGSCGGAAVRGPDGALLACAGCPNRTRRTGQGIADSKGRPLQVKSPIGH